LFVTLVECYCKAKKNDEALKTVKQAYEYLKGTKYEGEIKLAEAKIALCSDDTKTALKIISTIKSNEDIFIKVCLNYFIIHIFSTLFTQTVF